MTHIASKQSRFTLGNAVVALAVIAGSIGLGLLSAQMLSPPPFVAYLFGMSFGLALANAIVSSE